MCESAERIDILGLTRAGLEEAASRLIPEAAGAAAAVYASAFATGSLEPEALGLGAAKSASWRAAFSVGSLAVERVLEEPGELGATSKALLGLEDALAIECVRVPMAARAPDEGRGTLCVSSQVGCAMDCVFCETGLGGLSRSLGAGEIVAQVLAARLALGWSFRNIVFMGMGEPLDNAEAVFTAIEVLAERSGLGFGLDRISICTAGHVEGLGRLAERAHRAGGSGLDWRRLKLSVSLNAASDELRSSLMPINRRWSLAELASALRGYLESSGSPITLNYCLIPSLNDSQLGAERLAAFCSSVGGGASVNGSADISVRAGAGRVDPGRPAVAVNLIPYNPGSKPVGRAPTEDELGDFEARLRSLGLKVRRRATRGASIMAACGQLGSAASRLSSRRPR
jgi:23S rRNA (adenine2503-C2)-methyltransferase